MADDTGKRGVQDRSRINLGQEHEVRYWTKAFGVTREELETAIAQVGSLADSVREYLLKSKR